MLRHLITADQAFPEMERLVLGARESLDIALHLFSPRTKTRSAASHDRTLVDWGDLIADAARRGVSIRILLNDFDPAGWADMHARVWERVAMLGEAFADMTAQERQRVVVLVAHPGGQAGAALRLLAWPRVRGHLKTAIADFKQRGRRLPPGLDALDHGTVRWWPPTANFTQTLHQKFLLADGERAILGGLDIDERRYDDPGHRRNAQQTWHDVCVAFDGPPAEQLERHFERCWAAVQADGTSHAPAFRRSHPDFPLTLVDTAAHARARPHSAPAPDTSAGPCRIAATLPVPGRNPLRFGPRPDDCSLLEAHLELIAGARRYIYVESQFFRFSMIRDSLVSALERNRDLHLIMLLPGAPDVVAYEGARSGVQRYGEWLQMRACNRLADAFPDRFGVFSLTNDRDRAEHNERDALHGKAMVYVHSKLMIADDRVAIVGSANLNGRSMRWDVEAGLMAHDEGFAVGLRRDLWHVHLGEIAADLDPVEAPEGSLAVWRRQAELRRNAGRSSAIDGIVPFPLARTRRFAKDHLFVPEEMV
ncbi:MULTISPECIES: phospholipase D-like domain-containing protein [unclassified Roseitalea]|uniref:phospholipase D family protein n=1 Tax=unclassified Roseitalea TaxID=2639107 RepID=UPI00273DE1D4|nr:MULTISPECIES: phospholipase D-like domain-containing protein [unclassified Roseitalea]